MKRGHGGILERLVLDCAAANVGVAAAGVAEVVACCAIIVGVSIRHYTSDSTNCETTAADGWGVELGCTALCNGVVTSGKVPTLI